MGIQVSFDTDHISGSDIRILQAIADVLGVPGKAKTVETPEWMKSVVKTQSNETPDVVMSGESEAGTDASFTTYGSVLASDALIAQAAASVAPTPAVDGSVQRDSAGIPWDARIHSETRATKQDGTWRLRRNLDKAVLESVMAELKQTLSAPAAPAEPVSVAAPEAVTAPSVAAPSGAVPPPPVETVVSQAPATVPPVAAPPPPIPAVTPPPVAVEAPPAPLATPTPVPEPAVMASGPAAATTAPDANGMAAFAGLMKNIVEREKAGLDPSVKTEIAASLGLPNVGTLAIRLDLIPAFESLLATR